MENRLATVLKSRQIHRGKLVDLSIETVELPNGRVTDLEIVRHPGGAAVVATDANNRVCMLRQYRHAAGGWIWELPAGKLDAGEEPVATAHRELAEEAGVRATQMEPLGRVVTTPGFSDEILYLFRATGLASCPLSRQPDEVIEIHWLEVDKINSMIASGAIEDAKTLLGLLLARLGQHPMKTRTENPEDR